MQESTCVFGPVSSLLLWRAAQHGKLDLPEHDEAQLNLVECCARVRDFRKLAGTKVLEDAPLDALVGDRHKTHRTSSLNVITLQGKLPPNSFCRMSDGAYVCAPELVFALLARGKNLLQLLQVGCELCGDYAMAYDHTGSFVNAPAITSVDKIDAYLQQLGSRHGRLFAQDALHYVQDGSRSPRETELFLAYVLPSREGGYGLVRPTLNGKIELSKRQQRTIGKSYLRADQVFYNDEGEAYAAVEYDSNEHHLYTQTVEGKKIVDVLKVIADDERRELMRDQDVDVVTVRTQDTKDFTLFEEKALRVAKLVGCEPAVSSGSLFNRRIGLFEQLFVHNPWDAEHDELCKMAGYVRARKRTSGKGQS